MKISKIEPQKKNKRRSTIFIDGKFAFGLSTEIVVKLGLGPGDEIDNNQIKNVLLEQEKHEIRGRALRFLHYRKRSVQELTDRLLRIGFDRSLVEGVIEEFVADKTLDDMDFAESFIADHTRLKPKGNIFLRRELGKMGISKETVDQLVRGRDERQLAREYMERKLAHLNRSDPKDRRALLRRLLARGFTPDVVYDAVNDDEHEE